MTRLRQTVAKRLKSAQENAALLTTFNDVDMSAVMEARAKYSIGQPFMYPDNSLGYSGNFLRMTFGVPAESFEVNPVVEQAKRTIFILHADHEQNASTSTVRHAGSSGAKPFDYNAAGIAGLLGPAHKRKSMVEGRRGTGRVEG